MVIGENPSHSNKARLVVFAMLARSNALWQLLNGNYSAAPTLATGGGSISFCFFSCSAMAEAESTCVCSLLFAGQGEIRV